MKNKVIMLLLGLAVIITAGSGTPRLSPWDAWRMAYTTFEQGEEFRDKGEYTKAKESFEKALSYYRMVRSARPDWNQKVISERIADCQRESKKMAAFLGPATNLKSDVSTVSTALQAGSAETDTLRRELAEAKAELEELRKKNTARVNYETEIANLLRDQRVLNERYYLLERRYREAEEKLAAPDVKAGKLEEQLVTLRLQLDLARRESTAARQQSSTALAERNQLRSEKTRSENARRLAENQRDILSGQIDLARKNNEKLQRDLDSSAKRIRELMLNVEQGRKNNSALAQELQTLQGKYREKLRASNAGGEVNNKLLEENKKLQLALAAQRKKESSLSGDLLKYQRESELLRTTLSDERRKHIADSSKLTGLQQSVKNLNSELEREKANSVILSRELNSLRNNENSSARELKTLRDENSALKKRLEFRASEDFRNLTAANAERKKLRSDAAKLEQTIAGLRADGKIKDNQFKALERSVQELQSENRKLHAERINYEGRIKTLAGANANIQLMAKNYDDLKRNFAALQAENRQNKLAADAAKPREAELARIKLRLAELDGLKKQLSQEQSFNEQLNAVKRNLEQEVKQLRPMGAENVRLKNELADFKLLKGEVERLRKLNAELAGAKQLESEVAGLKVKLAQLTPEAAEAGKLRKRNLELEQGKILWENEISRLKLQLTGMTRLQDEVRKLNIKLQARDLEVRTLSEQRNKVTAANAALERDSAELKSLRIKSSRLVKDQALTLEQLRSAGEKLKQTGEQLALRDRIIASLKNESQDSAVKYRTGLNELKGKHKKELEQLLAKFRKEKSDAAAEYTSTTGKLRSEIEKLKKTLAGITEKSMSDLKKLQEKYQKAAADLKQERLLFAERDGNSKNNALQKIISENDQLRKKITLLEKNLDNLKNSTGNNRKEYSVLQGENEKLLLELDKYKRNSVNMEKDFNSRMQASSGVNSRLRRDIGELNKKLEAARVALSALQQKYDSVRDANTALKKANAQNINLEQELAKMRSSNVKLNTEKLQMHSLRQELAKVNRELKKTAGDLAVVRKHNEQLLNSVAQNTRVAEEIKAVKRLNSDLAEQRLKAESELASLKSELANYNRLRAEVTRLRKLNNELADAKNLESELAQAKVYISRLEQMRDELSRQRRLNEELSAVKIKLEKELAARPAMPSFAPADYVAAAGNPMKPIGKAEDYISAGKIAAADEKDDLAVWNYRTALKLAPENSEAAELLGRTLAARGDYAEAAPLLSRARNGKPDSIDLALAAADAYIALKRYGNADAIIEPLLKRNKENPRLQISAALIASGSGKYARAAGLLRLAGAKLPKDPTPKLELARLLLHTDSSRLFEAVKLYETARRLGAGPDLELEPKLASFLDKRRNMSDFLNSAAAEAAGNRDWNSVIWYNRQLIELDREPEKYRPRLAFAQYKKGSSGAALETLSMGTQTPLSMLLKAFIHLQRKESRESEQCALQAKAMNHGRIIEIPADWREFLIDFRRRGGKLKPLAR